MTDHPIRSAIFASMSALCAVATVAFAVPAHAAPVDAVPTATIRTADLDLASAAGAAQLDRRVRNALAAVCGTADIHDLSHQAQVATCRRDAMTRIAPRITAMIEQARATRLAGEARMKVAAR